MRHPPHRLAAFASGAAGFASGAPQRPLDVDGLRAVLALRSARIHRLNIRLFIPDIAGISAGDNPARAARTAVEMHS
jgi:hypothetical protein